MPPCVARFSACTLLAFLTGYEPPPALPPSVVKNTQHLDFLLKTKTLDVNTQIFEAFFPQGRSKGHPDIEHGHIQPPVGGTQGPNEFYVGANSKHANRKPVDILDFR